MDPIFFPSEKQLFQYGLSALVYRILFRIHRHLANAPHGVAAF